MVFPCERGLTLLSNSQAFVEEMDSRCDGSHQHQVVQGRETARTAVYPDDFAKKVVKAYDVWRNTAKVGVWQEDLYMNFPTTSTSSTSKLATVKEDSAEAALPTGGDAISFKGKVNPTVAGLLKRVHQNLGHPPMRELIRHLKIGGAQEKCDPCRRADDMTRHVRAAASRNRTRWHHQWWPWTLMR